VDYDPVRWESTRFSSLCWRALFESEQARPPGEAVCMYGLRCFIFDWPCEGEKFVPNGGSVSALTISLDLAYCMTHLLLRCTVRNVDAFLSCV
jgi:hypothetical protein